MSVATQTRVLPVVGVVYRVPLFLEAIVGAFDGVASVHAVRADDVGLEGFVRALRPDALIVEAPTLPERLADVTALHVDLERNEVRIQRDGVSLGSEIDLSPEEIRNAVLASIGTEKLR